MDDETKEYRWETGYEKTWEEIKDDDETSLEASIQEIVRAARKRRMKAKDVGEKVKLGLMRHVIIVLDMSKAMAIHSDLKPNRLLCCIKLLKMFINEYFYLNPISQLAIVGTYNKRTETIAELSSNASHHIECLEKLEKEARKADLTADTVGGGEPSLQNSLDTAYNDLILKPTHASREVVIIMGSLTTCDPSDIEVSIQNCLSANIRCSLISLSADVRIFKRLTTVTGGSYGVIVDDYHLRDMLFAHLDPPPASLETEPALIKMGFPSCAGQQDSNGSGLGMCLCHLDQSTGQYKLSSSGFLCPQCNSKYCELPVECKVCGLMLVSAPHLARSYHHLFPLKAFTEIKVSNSTNEERESESSECYSCLTRFQDSGENVSSAAFYCYYKCELCLQMFCSVCDLFIHDVLHSCPGCVNNTKPS